MVAILPGLCLREGSAGMHNYRRLGTLRPAVARLASTRATVVCRPASDRAVVCVQQTAQRTMRHVIRSASQSSKQRVTDNVGINKSE
jgi:hypothetical protein